MEVRPLVTLEVFRSVNKLNPPLKLMNHDISNEG